VQNQKRKIQCFGFLISAAICENLCPNFQSITGKPADRLNRIKEVNIMDKNLLDTFRRIQVELLNLFKELRNWMKKHITKEQEPFLSPFFKVTGILLAVVILIKWLSMGTLMLIIVLFAGLWIYFNRRESTDDREIEGGK